MKSYNDLFPKDIKHNIRELADKLPFLPEIIKKCKGSDESLKSLRQATQERNIALEKEKENYSQKIASNLNEQLKVNNKIGSLENFLEQRQDAERKINEHKIIHQNEINSNLRSIETIRKEMFSLEDNREKIEKEQKICEASINAIQAKLIESEENLRACQERLQMLEELKENEEDRKVMIIKQQKNTESEITQLEQQKAILENQITELKGKITKNENHIDRLETEMDNLENKILNEGNIEAQEEGNIRFNSQNVESLKQENSNLQEEIDDLAEMISMEDELLDNIVDSSIEAKDGKNTHVETISRESEGMQSDQKSSV